MGDIKNFIAARVAKELKDKSANPSLKKYDIRDYPISLLDKIIIIAKVAEVSRRILQCHCATGENSMKN